MLLLLVLLIIGALFVDDGELHPSFPLSVGVLIMLLLFIGAVGSVDAVGVVGTVVFYSLGLRALKSNDPPLFVDGGVLHPLFPLIYSQFCSLLLRVSLMLMLFQSNLIRLSFGRLIVHPCTDGRYVVAASFFLFCF